MALENETMMGKSNKADEKGEGKDNSGVAIDKTRKKFGPCVEEK